MISSLSKCIWCSLPLIVYNIFSANYAADNSGITQAFNFIMDYFVLEMKHGYHILTLSFVLVISVQNSNYVMCLITGTSSLCCMWLSCFARFRTDDGLYDANELPSKSANLLPEYTNPPWMLEQVCTDSRRSAIFKQNFSDCKCK